MFNFFLLSIFYLTVNGQTDTSKVLAKRTTSAKTDSLYMARLNNSGNLMIAAGIGLTGAGSYLIYQGVKIYTTNTPNIPQQENERNKRQGIIYMAAGGVGIVGGVVLTALGARNKVEFKRRKRLLSMEITIPDYTLAAVGARLNF